MGLNDSEAKNPDGTLAHKHRAIADGQTGISEER